MKPAIALILLVCALPGFAATAAARPCAPHAVYGDIGALYQRLGGAQGPLGCPLSDEADAGNGGRFNQFEHGQIVWSPHQGNHMTLAAWQAGDSVMLQWGPTDPYHYDKFLVRYDFNGANFGQQDWAGGNQGQFQINVARPGRYTLVVEGCDEGGAFSSSKCRQGWTVPINVDVVEPQGVAGGLRVIRETVPARSRGVVFDRPRFFSDALNAVWSAVRAPLCDQIVAQAGVADGAGRGYTLYDINCKLAPVGVLFMRDASGTTGAIDLTFEVPHNYFEATTTQPTKAGSWADPRFSLTYEILLHLRVDPAHLRVLAADYAVINPGRPDSHNVAANILIPIDGVLKQGIVRRIREGVQRSGRLDVASINDQLRGARDSLTPHLEGDGLRYAIVDGGMTITVRAPILDAHVSRSRLTRSAATQAVLKHDKASAIKRAADTRLTPMSRPRSAAAARALNPQPLPPGKAASVKSTDVRVSKPAATGANRKAIIIVGGQPQQKAKQPTIPERIPDYQDQHH